MHVKRLQLNHISKRHPTASCWLLFLIGHAQRRANQNYVTWSRLVSFRYWPSDCVLMLAKFDLFWSGPLRYQKWSKLRSKCNVTFNDNQLYLQDAIPVALEQSWVWPIGPSLWWQRDERPRDWLRSLDLSSWPKWDRLEREMRRICTPKWEASWSAMVFTPEKVQEFEIRKKY